MYEVGADMSRLKAPVSRLEQVEGQVHGKSTAQPHAHGRVLQTL